MDLSYTLLLVLADGVNLALTFSIAHALEDSAKVYAIASQLGTPVILPPDEVEKLHSFWLKNYGQKARM